MTPFYSHGGVDLYVGDALTVLAELPSESVQMCVTSPPFYGLRSYLPAGHGDKASEIGSEPTPAEYITRVVSVFAEVRRVLRPDGLLWIECGDSFAGAGYSNHANTGGARREDGGKQKHTRANPGLSRATDRDGSRDGLMAVPGFRPKQLMLIPHRLAIALGDDGWLLRQTNVWHRTAPMPESVQDRTTTAHSYVFQFAKQETYYYDAKAIAEPASAFTHSRGGGSRPKHAAIGSGTKANLSFSDATNGYVSERNRRSVWTINPAPSESSDAHFATFPTALVKPLVLCSTRPGDTVLDCFAGSGTSLLVAKNLGRHGLGIELSQTYARIIERRLAQDVLPLEAAL